MARYVDSYIDAEAFDPAYESEFYGRAGEFCTIIAVEGTLEIQTVQDFQRTMEAHAGPQLAALLRTKNEHVLSVSYEVSQQTTQQLDEICERHVAAARQKNMRADRIVREQRAAIERLAVHERMLIACWTLPKAGPADLLAKNAEKVREANDELPPRRFAMPVGFRLDALAAPHSAFVEAVLKMLADAKIASRVLGLNGAIREDLREIRRGLEYHETPNEWTPVSDADERYPRGFHMAGVDYSGLFALPLAAQLVTEASETDGQSQRVIKHGSRAFATMSLMLMPKEIRPFSELKSALVGKAKARSASGERAFTPFRMTWHIHSGQFQSGLRGPLVVIASGLSPHNRNVKLAEQQINAQQRLDSTLQFRAVRIVATTWREPGETDEILETRRETLAGALVAWGHSQVANISPDPMRTLAETMAGLTIGSTLDPNWMPTRHVARMLPFHSTAPIFKYGETLLTTAEGRIAPLKYLSEEQNTWLCLIAATPGSGKSVMLNRMGSDFATYSPGVRTPYIGSLDVGLTGKGLIDSLKRISPDHMKNQFFYRRLQNSARDRINPFDLGLGRRSPLEREAIFVSQVVNTLITPPDKPSERYRMLAERLVKVAYAHRSDIHIGTLPHRFAPTLDDEITDICERLNVQTDANMSWWNIVDELARHRQYRLAEKAQRHAVPVVSDLSYHLSSDEMHHDFAQDTLQEASTALKSALERYPILNGFTMLDIGDARVVSVDLNDVLLRTGGVSAHINNTLFVSLGRELFLKKIAGFEDEIKDMRFPTEMAGIYSSYWSRRYTEQQEAPKCLTIDEYHLTGGTEQIKKIFLTDAREGRKWGLYTIIASQKMRDFGELASQASSVMIMKVDSGEIRSDAKEMFPDLTDDILDSLQQETNASKARGVPFLLKMEFADRPGRWLKMVHPIGPEQLWSLATYKEERLVRDYMYPRYGDDETLWRLAKRFGTSRCKDLWDSIAAEMQGGDREENEMSIAAKVAEIVIRDTESEKAIFIEEMAV